MKLTEHSPNILILAFDDAVRRVDKRVNFLWINSAIYYISIRLLL